MILYNTFIQLQLQIITKYKLNMRLRVILLLALTITAIYTSSQLTCKLTIIQNNGNTDTLNKKINIYPTSYSSPVENLNNNIFAIYNASPLDGCTRITQPNTKQDKVQNYPILFVIDGDVSSCGFIRRINMAKDAGAKGIIILTENLQNSFDPYTDFSDNTFLVFIAQSKSTKTVLLSSSHILATITSQSNIIQENKYQLQFWISTLDTKSYQLLNIWQQTLKDIPSVQQKVNWKPRYALWGCTSGLFNSNPACLDKPQYLLSCACKGQFCSPQTSINMFIAGYKAADATVKEDIRQKIIFTDYPNKFLTYIGGFSQNCLKIFQDQYYAEDCANSLMTSLGISHQTVQSKLDKFMDKCSGDIYQSLLLDRNRFSQLQAYPAAILDRQPIQFQNIKDFQTQLCRKLGLDKQEGCVKITRVNTVANFAVSAIFYIFIIGGLIAIVLILVFVYRKSIRKQMHKQMKMQVAASVEHYFALTETNK